MKNLNPGDQPYHTSNAILAYCLHMAGVEWNNERQRCKVFYSEEIINRFTNGSGSPFYKGWELEKAVEHAHKTGKRGHVEYVFKRTSRLRELLRAFVDQCAELEKSEGFAHELVLDISAKLYQGKLEPDIGMLRLACIVLKMRLPFMEIWQQQVPRVVMKNEGAVTRERQVINTKHGEREALVVTSPGVKIVSLNASEKTRRELGL